MKYSLKWLDDWEARTGVDVTDNQFLTKSTSEGSRVTLSSCIELTDYLIDKFGFKYYVLSGKINQDALEVLTIQCRHFINLY